MRDPQRSEAVHEGDFVYILDAGECAAAYSSNFKRFPLSLGRRLSLRGGSEKAGNVHPPPPLLVASSAAGKS